MSNPQFKDAGVIATDGGGQGPKKEAQPPLEVKGVKHIVAVASGKGGVGKSTVSSNLAVALAMRGLKVGLLDADVYGPSQPRMLGVSGRPSSPDGRRIREVKLAPEWAVMTYILKHSNICFAGIMILRSGSVENE